MEQTKRNYITINRRITIYYHNSYFELPFRFHLSRVLIDVTITFCWTKYFESLNFKLSWKLSIKTNILLHFFWKECFVTTIYDIILVEWEISALECWVSKQSIGCCCCLCHNCWLPSYFPLRGQINNWQ